MMTSHVSFAAIFCASQYSLGFEQPRLFRLVYFFGSGSAISAVVTISVGYKPTNSGLLYYV